MNIYSIVGFIFAIFVLVLGLRLSSDDLTIFGDYPSVFIVVGGTVAATAISFQFNRILFLFTIFIRRVVLNIKPNYKNLIVEIMQLVENYRQGESLESLAESTKDPFLKEGLTLIADNVLEKDQLFALLGRRLQNMNHLNVEEANKIKFVAKFPPAFGMMGTTIGMIVLLANLGGPDSMQKIGPAMGVCLITTLYGVVLANLVFIPISEHLIEDTKENYLKNMIILEGLQLLVLKTNPIVVAETLNSFLRPNSRVDWKSVLNKG
jgi:chemotaxis protein MotA